MTDCSMVLVMLHSHAEGDCRTCVIGAVENATGGKDDRLSCVLVMMNSHTDRGR